MQGADTTMGGSQAAFPDTLWASVLSACDPNSPRRRDALNRLLSAYWRPIYMYIRTSRRVTIEEGKDLTQEFFRYVLEQDIASKYQREKGRFRHFLKGVLRNFLDDAERAQLSLKRGGDKVIVSLDAEGVDPERFLPSAREASPEQVFDRQWTLDLIARSVDELKRALLEEGDVHTWRVYEAYELGDSVARAATYADVARALALTEDQVRDRLRRVRERLAQLIRKNARDSVTSEADLIAELKELYFG